MNRPVRIAVPEDGVVVASGPARFTADEFDRMIACGAFENMKVELIDGELERMAPAYSQHALGQTAVVAALLNIVGRRRVLIDGAIRLDDATMVGGDAILLANPIDENRSLKPDDVLLVVEISGSTLEKDLGRKRLAYAAAGIADYWVVDVERRVVHVHGEPAKGDYAAVRSHRFGEPLAVPGVDGTITLD